MAAMNCRKQWRIVAIMAMNFPVFAAEPVAGSVKIVAGAGMVKRGGETLAAREGMHLLAKDVIQTVGDGRVGVIFLDGTRVSLGPNSELSVDEFAFAPAQGQLGLLLRLTRGILAYASGKIAQLAPQTVRLQTPVGIVGLRGTSFAVALEQP
jgi:hypothetical protein